MAKVLKIERSVVQDSGFVEIAELTSTSGIVFYPDVVPQTETFYYYRLRYFDTVTNLYGPYSPVDGSLIMNAPSDLVVTPDSFGKNLLTWTDNSAHETQFLVERSLNDAPFAVISTEAAGVTTYTDLDTVVGNKYIYRITAKKGDTLTVSSNEAAGVIVYGYTFKTGSYLAAPHNAAYDFSHTSSWTIETWFYAETMGDATKYLFAKYDTPLARGIALTIGANQLLTVLMRNSSSNQINVNTTVTGGLSGIFGAKKAYQLLVSYNGTNATGVTIRVDSKPIGKTVVANTLTGTTQNTKEILIGTSGDKTASSNHTQLLTRVFNRVVSQTEGETLFNGGIPLYDSGMSGIVWENKVNNDTFSGSNFTVVDSSATGANGTSTGMIATDRAIFGKLDAVQGRFRQPITGNTIYYNLLGDGGGDDVAQTMHSPFTDRMRTTIWYDAPTNRTYIGWQSRGKLGWNREPRLLYFDHAKRFCSPSEKAGYVTAGVIDGHPAPSVCGTPDGEILLVHEDVHSSPLYVKKTINKETPDTTFVTKIEGAYAYPCIWVIDGVIYIWSRGNVAGSFDTDNLIKSTDNGQTWSERTYIVNTGGSTRAYFTPLYSKNKLALFVNLRNDTLVTFTKSYYIESVDGGLTWRNYTNTFSRNIATDGILMPNQLNASYFVYGNGVDDYHMKAGVLTPSGKAVAIVNNGLVSNYAFVYHNGTEWLSRDIPVPLFTPKGGGGNNSRGDYWAMYAYSDTRFVFWRIEKRNTFDVLVQYETTNAFVSVDAGTVVSAADKNHEQLQATHNISDATKVIIGTSVLGANGLNDMFLYEYTPS